MKRNVALRLIALTVLLPAASACKKQEGAPPTAPGQAAAVAQPAQPTPSANPLRPGDLLPELSLKDQTGQLVALTSFRGKKVIVWFYPAALTPGCTAEGEGFKSRSAELTKSNLAVVGVSFDTPAKNLLFARKHGFTFPLLSDLDRSLALALGAAESASAPFARRVSALVDEAGRVLKLYSRVDPLRHPDEVLRDVALLAKSP